MMPPPAVLVVLALAAAALAPLGARAQISAPPQGAPAPASQLDCAGALRSLTPCLSYVERRSALTRPDKGCCGALAAVVGGDDAACLCALLGGHGVGVRVDPVRALALPTICRVDAPPPRLCAALGMPVAEPPSGAAAAAPMESGSDEPTATPAVASGGTAKHRRQLFLVVPTHYCLLSTLLLLLLLQL